MEQSDEYRMHYCKVCGLPATVVKGNPEEGIPGVEVILTRLHAGGKFSNKNYEFSGGLHGVGVSVVNALSSKVTVEVRRDGTVYEMEFKHGAKTSKLKKTGTVGKRNREKEDAAADFFGDSDLDWLDEEEESEPLSDGGIDVGEAVAECLGLALPPYPRAADADSALASLGDALDDKEPKSPFAALEKLKRQ